VGRGLEWCVQRVRGVCSEVVCKALTPRGFSGGWHGAHALARPAWRKRTTVTECHTRLLVLTPPASFCGQAQEPLHDGGEPRLQRLDSRVTVAEVSHNAQPPRLAHPLCCLNTDKAPCRVHCCCSQRQRAVRPARRVQLAHLDARCTSSGSSSKPTTRHLDGVCDVRVQ
jgi:hypothetical protein